MLYKIIDSTLFYLGIALLYTFIRNYKDIIKDPEIYLKVYGIPSGIVIGYWIANLVKE